MPNNEIKENNLNKAICECVALIRELNMRMSSEGKELERLVKEREKILNEL